MELSMSDTKTVSPLRQRMIEDMAARKLNPHTQRSHISSCKRVRRLAEAFARYRDARRGAALLPRAAGWSAATLCFGQSGIATCRQPAEALRPMGAVDFSQHAYAGARTSRPGRQLLQTSAH
jgi:hypothetical protein